MGYSHCISYSHFTANRQPSPTSAPAIQPAVASVVLLLPLLLLLQLLASRCWPSGAALARASSAAVASGAALARAPSAAVDSGAALARAPSAAVAHFYFYFFLFLLRKRTKHTMMPKRVNKCATMTPPGCKVYRKRQGHRWR